MPINIAENIRAMRKERKMTQEQLAEALGVTVGAVSKWESGASMPEITLIVEMASFFETSVDVLLGYEWQSGSMAQALAEMRALRNEKKFDEASAVAERALKKYPNSFDVVFKSAVLFSMKGIELHCEKSFRRALLLYERSLGLIAQNTNERINEWTIRNHIAEAYVGLGQTETALEHMKKNNADGLNNGYIGSTLMAMKKPEEALPYLSDALIDHITKMQRVITAYSNAYAQMKDYEGALEALLWMKGIVHGVERPGVTSYFDKVEVSLLVSCAIMSLHCGREEEAREYIREAKALAEFFDAEPDYGFEGMRFFHSQNGFTAFDDFGKTAMDGIKKALTENAEVSAPLWKELEEK